MKKYSMTLIVSLAASNPAFADVAQNYSDVKAFMSRLVAKYPRTVTLVDVGPSDSGETVHALKIGDGPVKNLVVATHHGNEYGSTEVAMAFAESIAQTPIAKQTVFVLPVLNVDGYNARERNEPANGDSLDPNRDYPGPCGTEGPFKLKSTHALAQFIDQQNIVASATMHTFNPSVTYPWGVSSPDLSTPYKDIFERLAKDATLESHYETGNSTDVVYAANGAFEDYAYWKHGIWSLLFELGNSHTPSDADIQDMINSNVPGLRRMLADAPETRAVDHAFHGTCDASRRIDSHLE